MKFLREIASIVTRYNRQVSGKVQNSGRRKGSSRYQQFLVGLIEGKYASDADAAMNIYGIDATHPRYRKLKSRVKDHLLHMLFSLDIRQPKNTAVLVALYHCTLSASYSKILITLGARNSGIALAHKTLIRARDAHLFDIVLQCAKFLRAHYSLIGLEKQFEEYDRMVSAMLRIQHAELESDKYVEHLMLKYARSTSRKSEFSVLAQSYMLELEKLKKEFPTRTIMVNYFRVKSFYYQIVRNYPATVQVCEEAEQYYQEYPHFATRLRRAEFALLKMVAFLYMRDYERGHKNAEQCISLYPDGSQNWLVFMEYYFLLALHSQNIHQAVLIFQKVTSHPKLQTRPVFQQEKWRVHEGYLNYVFESGWETGQSDEVSMFRKRFNIHKFLNEVPVYSKDKRGMNVSILILQILFLLERGQLDEITSRTDALRVYSSRYLRRDENYRSELFIRMLLTMEAKSFDYRKTLVATQGYQARLLATVQGKHGSLDGTEIIPFELLWDRILFRLKKGAQAKG